MRHRLSHLLAALACLCCAPVWAASHTVTVGGASGLMFSPRELSIDAGDTVTFVNAGGVHNVRANDGSFRCANGCDGAGGNGNPVSGNWQATVTFNTPGTFPYVCDVHAGSGMTGTITVNAAGPASVPITSGFTGTWVDSAASGQMGMGLEVLPGNNLVAEVYTYGADGGQLWVGGVGPIDGDTATITVTTIHGPGGRFPPNFDPAGVQNTPWGTLTFSFTDCNHGTVAWNPVVPGFGSGSLPISRVTLPAGLSCQ